MPEKIVESLNIKYTIMKKSTHLLLSLTLIMAVSFSAVAQSMKTKKVNHEFPELPYAYDALEKAIDSETMNIHYNKHFRGYYDKFLKAIEGTPLEMMTLEEVFANVSRSNAAVRNNAGGFYNHAMFWTIMSPNGGGKPSAKLEAEIIKSFGSFDKFKTEFENAAASQFGSGWAWLSKDSQGNLFISSTPNQDNPLMDDVSLRGFPILALDVWEHAYYLRYQNKRTSYIGNFWEIVNWPEVEKRFNM